MLTFSVYALLGPNSLVDMKNGYPNGIEIAAIVYSQILLVAIAAALAVAILAVTAAVVREVPDSAMANRLPWFGRNWLMVK